MSLSLQRQYRDHLEHITTHCLTKDGRLVKTTSKVLLFLVGKLTICCNPVVAKVSQKE